MRALYAPGMFDRTPELLRPGDDFLRKGHQAVGVTAIHTIGLFDTIEVTQLVAIDHQVVAARYTRNAIGAKADLLIDYQRHIQQRQGHNHGIDQRCCGDMQRRRIAKIAQHTHTVTPVQPARLGGETDLATFQGVLELRSEGVPARFHFALQPPDFREQFVDVCYHGRSLSGWFADHSRERRRHAILACGSVNREY